MTTERRITRTVELSARAVAEGMVTLPDGVTYLAMLGHAVGEFPHAADPEGCDAALVIRFKGSALGVNKIDAWCTREDGHDGPHVAHLQRGMPLTAWTDAENRRQER